MPEEKPVGETGAVGDGASRPKGGDARYASWLWLFVSVVVVAADQFAKQLIIRHFELYERVAVTPFLDIIRLHNTGAAFSLLADAGGWQNWFFSIVALAVSVVLVWWLRRVPMEQRVVPLGLTLVLGGAIGNLVDRLLHGYVVDFVLVYYDRWSYPAFNVADSAITCGVILLLVDGVFLERRRAMAAADAGR